MQYRGVRAGFSGVCFAPVLRTKPCKSLTQTGTCSPITINEVIGRATRSHQFDFGELKSGDL